MQENYGHAGGQKPAPWGFWPTIGFSCVIAFVYFLVQVAILAVFAVVAALRTQDFDIESFANSLQSNGFFLSVTIYVTAPFTIGLMILFAKIRQPPRLLTQGGAAGKKERGLPFSLCPKKAPQQYFLCSPANYI